VVGYGPHPQQCIEELGRLDLTWVLGNHELMLLGELPLVQASSLARKTLDWTRSALPASTRQMLARLPVTAQLPEGIVVTHGSLRDPNVRVRLRDAVAAEFTYLEQDHPGARLLILGNTHRAMLASTEMNVKGITLRGKLHIDPRSRYLINPGSVGQSRQLSGRARAAILDTDADTIEFVSESYETSGLIRDLNALGFPPWSYHRSPLRRFGDRLRRKLKSTLGLQTENRKY
jgi:diadenosine tetraphosphatase ApaH/serine/threonine PP2A family protein phosphatase